MWPYWVMFLLPAAGALSSFPAPRRIGSAVAADRWTPGWRLAAVALTLTVGYRFRVGGDWANYLRELLRLHGATLSDVLSMSDPGYALADWISLELGWDVYGVNLLCGALLTAGLVRFCRSMPRPWLALTVAVPYLLIVVGMGYSRQGVALGLSMLGLVALRQRSTLWFVGWVLLGATFHKTAIVMLPIAALANTKTRAWTAVWVGATTILAYVLLLQDSVESLYSGYVDAQFESEGALVRLLMNAIPAIVLLVLRHRFAFEEDEKALWRWIAVAPLALLALLVVSPSSTAVDRIALYMLPLQLVVFSHLPEVMGSRQGGNQGWVAAVVAYYGLVLFVWLNFATHARFWIPYRFYPLEIL